MQRPVVIRKGFLGLLFLVPDVAPIDVGFGVFAIQPQGVIEIFDCTLVIAARGPRSASILLDPRFVGVEFDGHVIIGDRPRVIARLKSCQPPVVQSAPVFGIQSDRDAAVRDRFAVFA